MKFVISLFVSFQALGSPINILHEGAIQDAEIYKTILMNDYKVPEELIAMRSVQDCEAAKRTGHLDLCLKNNGDLNLVSVDREFINESLKVFQSP